ncbi:MAG TPA: pirin family protein [Actinomycetota bacterium]|nr:pirin family protein [Actinomycetota bacterium]
MSNLEQHPREAECGGRSGHSPEPVLLEPRIVPLGGPRAMTVRRTLPHKRIRTVGAWCFVDHYGPDRLRMSVPPHPHIGLQTVTWLLSGQVEHRDSVGSHQVVRPGELNVMTAGRGISHSEYSTDDADLHGVQLWVALPDRYRDAEPAFEHHAGLPRVADGSVDTTVMVGEFAGARSAATSHSPLVGAEIRLTGAAELPIEPDFEYAVLALDTEIDIGDQRVPHAGLQYLGWGRRRLQLAADRPARVLILGGEPMSEHLLMWWNFVARTHEEIVAAREQWQSGDARFGIVAGDPNPRLPAPPMPTVALRPRPPRR